ncbi:hypothetical protein C1645_200975 [Glomus cerebriforme]|uniref:HCP-like protein n=1 Tax=Glomus cerebriforme TaxID=658196 RepID=A0A397T2K0_9GLOM|nr:hypothetical protein C1645_200975 [Glomus cerebriforme]
MPEKYKQLEIQAVQHDPDYRTNIARVFEVLRDCVKESLKPSSKLKSSPKQSYRIDQETYAIPTNLPDFESFKYMTLSEATKQHKLVDKTGYPIGDIETAYKCFEAYANFSKSRNQIKAKYYKAYYISRGLVESPKEKDKMVAELFKEVSDDEANEFPEAKVRYGHCLYNGKGVEQDFAEALKYFEKAAVDGFKVAMYNAGNIYYKGINGKQDKEKAINYMKMAAYNDYEPAIKFCKEHNL